MVSGKFFLLIFIVFEIKKTLLIIQQFKEDNAHFTAVLTNLSQAIGQMEWPDMLAVLV